MSSIHWHDDKSIWKTHEFSWFSSKQDSSQEDGLNGGSKGEVKSSVEVCILLPQVALLRYIWTSGKTLLRNLTVSFKKSYKFYFCNRNIVIFFRERVNYISSYSTYFVSSSWYTLLLFKNKRKWLLQMFWLVRRHIIQEIWGLTEMLFSLPYFFFFLTYLIHLWA